MSLVRSKRGRKKHTYHDEMQVPAVGKSRRNVAETSAGTLNAKDALSKNRKTPPTPVIVTSKSRQRKQKTLSTQYINKALKRSAFEVHKRKCRIYCKYCNGPRTDKYFTLNDQDFVMCCHCIVAINELEEFGRTKVFTPFLPDYDFFINRQTRAALEEDEREAFNIAEILKTRINQIIFNIDEATNTRVFITVST